MANYGNTLLYASRTRGHQGLSPRERAILIALQGIQGVGRVASGIGDWLLKSEEMDRRRQRFAWEAEDRPTTKEMRALQIAAAKRTGRHAEAQEDRTATRFKQEQADRPFKKRVQEFQFETAKAQEQRAATGFAQEQADLPKQKEIRNRKFEDYVTGIEKALQKEDEDDLAKQFIAQVDKLVNEDGADPQTVIKQLRDAWDFTGTAKVPSNAPAAARAMLVDQGHLKGRRVLSPDQERKEDELRKLGEPKYLAQKTTETLQAAEMAGVNPEAINQLRADTFLDMGAKFGKAYKDKVPDDADVTTAAKPFFEFAKGGAWSNKDRLQLAIKALSSYLNQAGAAEKKDVQLLDTESLVRWAQRNPALGAGIGFILGINPTDKTYTLNKEQAQQIYTMLLADIQQKKGVTQGIVSQLKQSKGGKGAAAIIAETMANLAPQPGNIPARDLGAQFQPALEGGQYKWPVSNKVSYTTPPQPGALGTMQSLMDLGMEARQIMPVSRKKKAFGSAGLGSFAEITMQPKSIMEEIDRTIGAGTTYIKNQEDLQRLIIEALNKAK